EETGELRETGYRHFFYQEIGGRDYLVWQKEDDSGYMYKPMWQRGQGGPNVPDVITIDDDENEQLILDILQALYIEGVDYTSYSKDGRYYLRKFGKNRVVLMEREDSKDWVIRKEYRIQKEPAKSKEEDGYKVFKSKNIEWRVNKEKKLDLKVGETKWVPVIGNNGGFSEYLEVEYDAKEKGYMIFDSISKRVVIARSKEGADELRIICDIKVEKLKESEEWEGKIVRLIGYTGLGKDEILRAAGHLMNEEEFFVAGNYDMEPEDFFEYQTLGIEQGLTTGHLYTVINKIFHHGGWGVIDELSKIKPKVLSALKTAIVAKTHQRWVKDDREKGGEKLDTMANHSRSRLIGTLNQLIAGITGAGYSDQATQDRFKDVPFVWREPSSEKRLQFELALRKLKKIRPELEDEELDIEKERIRTIVDVLVDVSWPMRLVFAGYDAEQVAKLTEGDFKNWDKLLKDATFAPKTKAGKNLKRAPSPRVIGNIVQQAIMFPKLWENEPWTIVEMWFNLYADDLKPQEKKRQSQAIKTQFENPSQRGGDNGIKNKDNLPAIELTLESFKVEGEYLIVTPKKVEVNGEYVDYWDQIKVWIHPDSREHIEQYGLPEEVEYWLGTQSIYNSRQMYLALQVRALGKSLIFVGKQGTGKSVLAETICILLDGEEVPQIEIKKDTDKEELTFRPYLRGAISGFDYGPYAVGVRDHKTVISEETTQGQPGVIGVSNEVIERQFIMHPDGTKIGKEGDGRFGVIHAINPPGNSRFLVKAFSDEYIERHAVLWFEPSSSEEMYNYLLPVSERKGIRVNPRIIGEKLRNADGEVVLVNGQEKWIGLVGMVQDLLIKEETNPLDKKLPLRIPGYRALKSLIKDMRSYWEVNAAFSKDQRQELL
ncbi:MAG: AAA family ATPase, partial [Candidatus Omnitrophica bacterium]|nr:AAA family ATPase [Candidatus Omnitrophota bacterium]